MINVWSLSSRGGEQSMGKMHVNNTRNKKWIKPEIKCPGYIDEHRVNTTILSTPEMQKMAGIIKKQESKK
ncbi:MAG: hypothetical protein ACP5QW_07295 [bacterium]